MQFTLSSFNAFFPVRKLGFRIISGVLFHIQFTPSAGLTENVRDTRDFVILGFVKTGLDTCIG